MKDLMIGVRNVEPDDGRLWVYVEAGSAQNNAGALCAISFDPKTPKLDTLDNVALYGQRLRAEIEKHSAIKQELAQIFSGGADRAALQFLVIAGEDVRWESLCNQNANFLALDDAYHMVRITTRTPPPNAQNARRAELPLRMLAYLSPAGVSAAEEFKNLCTQIAAAQESGLDIEASVYVGEQDIINNPVAFSGVAPGKFKGITVQPTPQTSEIEKQLRGSYQFLHFFCHGVEKAVGLRGLSLATINDQENKKDTGSVLVPLETLTAAIRLNPSVWIAVFNSCSGAAGTRAFNSLAWNVAKHGCPFAVGMAEPIEPRVAVKFSNAFYEALFKTTRDALLGSSNGKELALDLSKAITPARKALRDLCQQDGEGAYGRWLTPLVYLTAPNPLMVFLGASASPAAPQGGQTAAPSNMGVPAGSAYAADMVKRVNTIASTLRVLPRDSSAEEVRKGIYDLLNQPPVVPSELWPDKYGQFHERIERPASLSINAWTGAAAPVQALEKETRWALHDNIIPIRQWLAAPEDVDERDWTHPDVGWGLVLPDNDAIPLADRIAGADAPEPLRRLLKARSDKIPGGAPVLRWRRELQQGYLRRYYADGAQDLSTMAIDSGVAHGRVPRYLLIYATPKDIPWTVQYALSGSCYVGRLDLTGEELNHYVDALLTDWEGQKCDPRAPLLWSAVHDKSDITYLMAGAVAAKIWEKLDDNKDLVGRRWLRGADATREKFAEALCEKSPALIVTTSHGMTGPLDDPAALLSQLGAPVDVNHAVLGATQLASWNPSGAIWYSNACCAAGADAPSRYRDLMPESGAVGGLLGAIATAAGAAVAPLPKLLLGAKNPLRAFVGHVEPTFDWTLQNPQTRQLTSAALCTALTTKLYNRYERNPIGWAMHQVYEEAGAFYGAFQQAVADVDNGVPGARNFALYRQLAAMDRQTTVILGDPTVSIPFAK